MWTQKYGWPGFFPDRLESCNKMIFKSILEPDVFKQNDKMFNSDLFKRY